jgi:hypothetical protein
MRIDFFHDYKSQNPHVIGFFLFQIKIVEGKILLVNRFFKNWAVM